LSESKRGATRETNVAVIGGGPAGATCALALARGGISVTLVHWDGYACSGIELVSGRARQMLEQDSPGLFHRLPWAEIRETVSLWDAPDPVTMNAMFDPWGPGVALERSLLDQSLRHLAHAAGASIVADTKATHIERSGEGWRLLLRSGETGSNLLNSRFVVIATGRVAGSLVGRPPAPESSHISLMMPLAGQGGVDQGHTLYIESADNGWWYALPAIGGGYFAGFCTRREEIKKRQGSLREFFIQELCRTRLLSPLLPGAADNRITGRTADASPFTGAAGNGWIAIGDAAYAPDPLSGTGIERAIESARLGAGALLEVMEGGRASARFAEYEDKIREGADRHGRTAAYHYGRL
jgi:flavin-dependent dehydrogenase